MVRGCVAAEYNVAVNSYNVTYIIEKPQRHHFELRFNYFFLEFDKKTFYDNKLFRRECKYV